MPKVALVTCAELPNLTGQDRVLLGLLEERGVEASPQIWNNPEVDWDSFDLLIIRSVWDYSANLSEFLTWATQRSNLANDYTTLHWNTDKHYIQDLEELGLPVMQTTWIEPDHRLEARDLHNRFPAREEFVVKPAISAGSRDTGRYTSTSAESRRLAILHGMRLIKERRSFMVQRYLPAIDIEGESELIFLNGEYSHSVKKAAKLSGPSLETDLTIENQMSPYEATDTEIKVATELLAGAQKVLVGRGRPDEPFLYARVDLVFNDDREPLLMELELIEPSLWGNFAEGAHENIADAFAKAAFARAEKH